jgi:general secretion pathway protein L
MATTKIGKSEALIWLPPRSVGERAFASEPCMLVLGSEGGYQRLSLEAIVAVRSVRLIFDARDVTVSEVKLPPLKGAKLRQALPGAIEDFLLQDPSLCVLAFVKVPKNASGISTVAALDKSWFEFVLGAFERRKINVVSAHAAHLVLPQVANSFDLVALHEGIGLAWLDSNGAKTGMGWGASSDADFRAESLKNAVQSATLVLTGKGVDATRWPVRAFVEDASWQSALEQGLRHQQRQVQIEPLPRPERFPLDFSTLDFMPSRSGTALSRWAADTDWRRWRLPLAISALALICFLIGLNLHWARLGQEKIALKEQIDRRFKQTFPSVPLVVDPIAQGQKALANLRARNGQSGPDDFLPLLTRFSQALGDQAGDSLSSVEYREGKLKIRFKPEKVEAKNAREALVQAAQRLGLKLSFEDERQGLATVSSSP